MDTIYAPDRHIHIPDKFGNRYVVTFPWSKHVATGKTTILYFRQGDKPYIPEGFVEITKFGEDPVRFRLKKEWPGRALPELEEREE